MLFRSKLWDKTVLTQGHEETAKIIKEGENKCYYVISGSYSPIAGDKSEDSWNNSDDYWIVKFCEGEAVDISPLEFSDNELVVYPVPVRDLLNIRFDGIADEGTLVLTDIAGKVLLTRQFFTHTSVST